MSTTAPAGAGRLVRAWRGHPWFRWALLMSLVGAVVGMAVLVKGIFSSSNSTAAIGFLFLPFFAAFGAVPAFIWGAAAGWLAARRRAGLAMGSAPAGSIVAVVVVIALPAAIATWAVRGYALQEAVRDVPAMTTAQLEEALSASPHRGNKFFLGALAQHPAASAPQLDRIARIDNPELSEGMGSMWDVMGKNRKGLSVVRLVAGHANTSPETLAWIAGRAPPSDILHDVLANPHTPQAVLARYFDAADSYVQSGLARNPATPYAVLDRLSRSPDTYVRMYITWNTGAPADILERLASDSDELVARNAAQALDRRARESAKAR